MEKYDIAILGAGPGGYVAAIRAAQLGVKVCVVEREEVGGTCLNWGCIPTKALVASVRSLEKATSGKEYGFEIEGAMRIHFDRMMTRKNEVVKRQVKGITSLFSSYGIRLHYGAGRLHDKNTIEITDSEGGKKQIYGDKIILATGSRPSDIPGVPVDGQSILSSNEALALKDIPASMLIIGAGAIGCEFASIFHALGSDVTLVELLPRVVPMEDEEISGILERELKKRKIKFYANSSVESVERENGTSIKAHLSNDRIISAEKVLVSVGRAFNVEDIGLEAVGIEQGARGEISVNNRMETNIKGVYAIGDVIGGMMLAHVASREGIVAVENALGGDETVDYSAVPSCIFFNPEIASVGYKEKEVVEEGKNIRVGRFPMRSLGMAHALGEISGLIKVICDSETDRILGVHMIGPHVTEIIHEAVLAIQSGYTGTDWGKMIHAHPTMSEALQEAVHDLHGAAIHLPQKQQR
ncbi:MAG: dihydrolipoyl dehydrogenase [Gemmatimonadota bacterium]|nr:MAG: dihydrolipoyl dehydrogenase [Gemmatimonadota bacterium]